MTKWVAERRLKFSPKGMNSYSDLTIRIGLPYLLEEGMVSFDFAQGTAGCTIEIDGPNPKDVYGDSNKHEVYGADSLQALQIAADVEPVLKRLNKKYDISFQDGESYFEN